MATAGAWEAAPQPTQVPKLAPKLRLKYDPVRAKHLLLMPERVVVLNESAGEILSLVDGERTVDDIVTALEAKFPGVSLRQDVLQFMERVVREGWVVVS